MITIKFTANTAAELREQINDYLGETVVNVAPTAIVNAPQTAPSTNVVSTPIQHQPVATDVGPNTWQPGGGLVEELGATPAAVSTVYTADSAVRAPEKGNNPPPLPVAPQPVAVTAPVAPVKEYTLEEIQRALQPLMDAGRTQEIVDIMTKYGVAALTALPKEQYPNVVNDIRALGAHI